MPAHHRESEADLSRRLPIRVSCPPQWPQPSLGGCAGDRQPHRDGGSARCSAQASGDDRLEGHTQSHKKNRIRQASSDAGKPRSGTGVHLGRALGSCAVDAPVCPTSAHPGSSRVWASAAGHRVLAVELATHFRILSCQSRCPVGHCSGSSPLGRLRRSLYPGGSASPRQVAQSRTPFVFGGAGFVLPVGERIVEIADVGRDGPR